MLVVSYEKSRKSKMGQFKCCSKTVITNTKILHRNRLSVHEIRRLERRYKRKLKLDFKLYSPHLIGDFGRTGYKWQADIHAL